MGEIAHLNQREETFSLTPRNLDEAMKYADLIAKSDIVPADYRGKPANVLVAIQMGLEIGLPPLQALQNISVVNGRPAVWGDSLMAIARSHPSCEYITETFDEQTTTATCRAKRKGGPEEVRTFSKADAETAGLWGRNTWKQYPKRMLQMRARGFAIRDTFPDALRGIALAEEVQDYPVEREVNYSIPPEPEPPAFYSAEAFDENYPKWRKLIEAGKRTPDQIIAMVESKAPLSAQQQQQIRKAEPIEGGSE